MPITVNCPECARKYRVPDDKAGKRMKCKECDAVVSIPAGDEFGDDEFADYEPPEPRRRSNSSGSRKKSAKASSKFTSPVQLAVGGVVVVATVGIVWFILAQRGVISNEAGQLAKTEENQENQNKGTAKNTPNGSGNLTGQQNSTVAGNIPQNQTEIARKKAVSNSSPPKASGPPEIAIQPTSTFTRLTPFPENRKDIQFRITISKNGQSIHTLEGPLHDKLPPNSDGNPSSGGREVPKGALKRQPLDAAREAARQSMFFNKLKSIALAFHNYHQTYNKFPDPFIQGKGLSWRVSLLPYLGEGALYKQFKQDEPWNSEHNKKLISKIPAIYATDGPKSAGKSRIHVFVGWQTPFGLPPRYRVGFECRVDYSIRSESFDPAARYQLKAELFRVGRFPNSRTQQTATVSGQELQGKTKYLWHFEKTYAGTNSIPRLRLITDGTSNTLLAVAGGPETATVWTKPGGIPFDTSNPISQMGSLTKAGFAAVFFDGRATMLPGDIPAATMANMICHFDGKSAVVAEFLKTARNRIRKEVVDKNLEVMNTFLGLMDEYSKVMNSVKNRATARSAATKLNKLYSRMQAVFNEIQSLPRPNTAENALLEKRQGSRLKQSQQKFQRGLISAQLNRRHDPSFAKEVDALKSLFLPAARKAAKYKDESDKLRKKLNKRK